MTKYTNLANQHIGTVPDSVTTSFGMVSKSSVG